MKIFVLALVAMVGIAGISSVLLKNGFETTSAQAYATQGVRL